MAHNTRPTTGIPPTTTASNGVVTAPAARGLVGGNRKKQKRRAKQAANPPSVSPSDTPHHQHTHHHDADFDVPHTFDPNGSYYSDDEDDDDDDQYEAAPYASNGVHPDAHSQGAHLTQTTSATKRKSKKKRRSTLGAQQNVPFNGHIPDPTSLLSHVPLPSPLPPLESSLRPRAAYRTGGPPLSPPLDSPLHPRAAYRTGPPALSTAAFRSVQRSTKQDRIWNTSTQEERERIKDFWLSLSEEDRKSLLKIEKEAVLRKMKEQQKHSCSCTVCGRKRTAIEEELEVLYDAYYKELEQYANHQAGDFGEGMLPPHALSPNPALQRDPAMPLPLSTSHPTGRVHEIIDDEDDDEQELSEDEEDEYSDEDDELYSDEDDEPEEDVRRGIGADFFNFGNSLTVKGGILTVADDLLKNDGKKFIEMMEQLAERRMQREQEAEYAASQPAHAYTPNGHEPPLDDDDYDEEEEEYDSQDDYDEEEEEDEMGGMTEEQRMEEGRRMFQIFAARMFEQRVLTAYREKVARERQQKLLEELEDESRLDAEKEAKKARDAEKRKNKKLVQKQVKAEEKAKREAEKAAEEAAAKAIEEKKQEEQRRRKEEQRKKKEAERKAQEEEKQRKEAERVKRQAEERERRQETERKLQEQKALEKKQRDEARKKEREEREVKEKELKERKVQEDKERKERDARNKAERERGKLQQQAAQQPQIAKRSSQAAVVAVPPGLLPKQTPSGLSSPYVSVATPVLPKTSNFAPTGRQTSNQGSHGSSPKTSQASSGASKSTSPSSETTRQSNFVPKTILQKPPGQQPLMHHPQPHTPINQVPPPGIYPQHHNTGFGGFAAMGGFTGYHGPQNFMGQRQPLPGFPHQGPIGSRFQPFHATNGLPGPPPGMNNLGMMGQGRGFPMETPPGFQQQPMAPVGPSAAPGFASVTRHTMPSHSRTHSQDKTSIELTNPAAPTPIQRPVPIQRPSSVRPREGADVDDLSRHLGSSALLDDADDPLPTPTERRLSALGGPRASIPVGFSSPMQFGGPPRMDSFGNPTSSWTSSAMAFGPPGMSAGSSSWGAVTGMNSNSWAQGGFAGLGGHRSSIANRPLTIRLAVCQACKQLATRDPTSDDYHSVDSLLRQIELSRPFDSPISLSEIEEICETEGDAQNGGGLLDVRHDNAQGGFSVKFEPDAATPSTGRPLNDQGVIGSPMPTHSLPSFGGGGGVQQRGFGSLGGAIASSASGFS